ncbi:MAG: serine/threonine-protein kinase [Cyanobacteria bacterium P01_A01_bin.15]
MISRQRSSYRLLGLVGNGQFGRVYCGVHRKTGHLVAIKHLHRHSLPTHAFLRELHCLLKLEHPNIVACHALEHTPEGRLLVLEYCAGGTLRSHMAAPPSAADILTLLSDMLGGLAYAHQQGVIHCDIKPENILLTYRQGRWRAKISDFGIAKLIEEQSYRRGSGQTGSPAYMAPERFYCQYSPAADVYAMGIILYELLMGHRPFAGTPADLQSAHLNQPVPKVKGYTDAIQHIITKALEKLPARRYPTAAEMLADLQSITQENLPCPSQVSPSYYPYTGASHLPLTQPVSHMQALPATADRVAQTVLAQGKQLTTYPSAQERVLDSPIQGLYSAPTGLMVSTACTLWHGSNSAALAPIVRWPAPSLVAVDPRHRWAAAVTPSLQRLTITQLPRANQMSHHRPISLAPDIHIDQVLTVDGGHVAIAGRTQQSESQLQLWNRRGMSLGSLNLGIPLRQFTPMRQPYQWLAIDINDPQTVIFLILKPLRITPMRLDILPTLMLDLPWGYLFSDAQGRMLLLDRDFQSIGGIQGPAQATAIVSPRPHELLVATWQAGIFCSGGLHRLNLQNFELDIIF